MITIFGSKRIRKSVLELPRHFEQPHHNAYAILLVPTSGQTAGYKIVVLGKPSGEYVVNGLVAIFRQQGGGLLTSRK